MAQALYDACDRLARRPLPEPADVDAADFEREAGPYTSPFSLIFERGWLLDLSCEKVVA